MLKKAIILIIILISSSTIFAADPNMLDFTSVTTPAATDYFYLIRDPLGAPLDKKITYANLLASWIGTASITTLGTITTGTWTSTDIGVAYGGTGASTLGDGFVLLGNAAGAIQTLDVTTDGGIIIGDGTTDPVVLDVGSSTGITILGTIATGVWQGTAIADAYIPNDITINLATLATNVTTNANLTGDVTSVGNAADITESVLAVGGTDTIFPADPGADRLLMWDDDPGALVWSAAGAGDFLADGSVPMTDAIAFPVADASPNANGELLYDSTVAGLDDGAFQYFAGGDTVYHLVGTAEVPDDADDDKVIAYDKDTDRWYMKADADTGGATAYNSIGDPTGAGSIAFDDGETATYTGANEDEAFFNIILSKADLTVDTTALKINAVDDDDENYIPFSIHDDSGVADDLLFQIDYTGTVEAGIWNAGAVTSSGAITATSGMNLGTSQALVGTTAMTIGNNGQTVAIDSSDWNIDATGIATGMGDITSNGVGVFENATVSTAATFYGLKVNNTKTAGVTDAADNIYGTNTTMTFDQVGGTIGHVIGSQATALLANGTVGDDVEDLIGTISVSQITTGTVTDDMQGLQILTNADAGTVSGDIIGLYNVLDIEVGMTAVTGSVYGAYIDIDEDQGAGGSVYMLYLEENSGIDYGIYQNGTAANVLGGALSVTGAVNIIGATTLGTATSAAGNLSLYDAGTLTLYEDGDNFNVTLACNSGEAVGTLTGGLDITGLLTVTNMTGTASLATTAAVATAVTITDNEDTAENNPIVFVAGGDLDGGDLGLESDGTTYYTPSTGTITATEFVGGGVGITGVTASHDGTITWTGTSILETGAAFQFGDATDATLTHTYANTGTNVSIAYSTAAMAVTGALTATSFGGITEANLLDKTATEAITGAWDFGGGDLEIPQISPGVPGADGGIEMDFTDGKLIMQHGSAHAELAGSTDVAMGSLIHSWSGTIFAPDGVNDVITVKAINSIEFPHGVVITAVYLGIASNTTYVLTVQNFDDFDTINGANPTIDAVTYTADTTGEIIDSTPTYATIAAGQIIMISIPATDVDWIHFEIYYYEPAA